MSSPSVTPTILQTSQTPATSAIPDSSNASLDIAIIGAGISGLSLAIGLLPHAHLRVRIYESAPAFEEIGAGIGFGRNAIKAMKLIDQRIYDGFERVGTGQGRWFDYYWGGKGGVHMACDDGVASMIEEDALLESLGLAVNVKGEEGGVVVDTVHRKDFLDVLASLVPHGITVFNKRLLSISESHTDSKLTITFHNGTTATADAVIGCDGIRSATRAFVLASDSPWCKPVFSGKYCYRGLVPMEKAKEVLGERAMRRQMFLAKGGHVLTFPIEGGKTLNVVAMHAVEGNWEGRSSVRTVGKVEMLRDFESHSGMIGNILGMMDGNQLQWALFDHAPSPIYFNDRVCLLGDAAHACTPHQGAGAGQAIEDAYILSNLLSSCHSLSSLVSAFAAYDTVRGPRTQGVVKGSRERGQLLSLENPEIWKGEALDLGRIEELMRGEMDWIWDVDLGAELKKARVIFTENETRELGV